MISVKACPVCNGTNFQPLAQCKDYTVSHETFNIICCSECELGITDNRPIDEDLGRYYLSDNYISHSGKSDGIVGLLYKAARDWSLRWKYSIIKNLHNPSNALDFGCGTGEFLSTLKNHNWNITGVEPSDIARKKAETLTKTSIHKSIATVTGNFQVITAWHVLEHVSDPKEILQKFNNLLSPNGTILVAVPNYQSPDSTHYKNYWAGYDVPRHLWHFSKNSMKQLLKRNGLKIKQIIPMKLDAFYVSLLSEKYKNPNSLSLSHLTKGFFSGMKSNIQAKKTNNYSSLIYLATKDEN